MKSILLLILFISVLSFKSLRWDSKLDSGVSLSDDEILDVYQDWLLHYK